ncbi:hypothetical protein ACED51_04585 [Photobacterium swingsii]|uniref:hypothetical protein n=1 Tax=Photobacterium swingsii TaxID=680026 RepID=UPI00352E760C
MQFNANTDIRDVFDTYGNPDFNSVWKVNGDRVTLKELDKIYSASRWEVLGDITVESLFSLKDEVSPKLISLFLTTCYRLMTDEPLKDALIDSCLDVHLLKIHEQTYRDRQLKKRDAKKKAARDARREAMIKADKLSDNNTQALNAIARSLKTLQKKQAHIAKIIEDSVIDGQLDSALFMREIRNRLPKTILTFDKLIDNNLLPDYFTTEQWNEMTAHWATCEDHYFRIKKYEKEADFKRSLNYLNTYLFVFLPVWYHYNKCNIEFPKRLEMFKGTYFVSRPDLIQLKQNYPDSLLTFIENTYHFTDTQSSSHAARLKHIDNFFTIAGQRAELFDVPLGMPSPILKEDVPVGQARNKTAHLRIPPQVFPVVYQMAFNLCDWFFKINKLFQSGEISKDAYSNAFKKSTPSPDGMVYKLTDLKDVCKKLPDLAPINIDGKPVKFDMLTNGLAKVASMRFKNRQKLVPMVRHQPMGQIAVCLEAGLRHQSLQWMSCDFDKHITSEDIEDDELYPFNVNVDKVKKVHWVADVSGRVIKLLRRFREQRNLLDYPTFEQPYFYENNPKSKWGSFLPLFSFTATGAPFSDTTYVRPFRELLYLAQELLRQQGYKCDIVELVAEEDEKEEYRRTLKTKITPHCTRVTVVSEYLTFLPADYVGKKITGQKKETVAYYNVLSDEDYQRIKTEQKNALITLNSGRSLSNQGSLVQIDTSSENSTIVTAFDTDKKAAAVDFNAVSPAFIDYETNGVGLITGDDNPTVRLGYGRYNMCPYDYQCPKEIVRKGLKKRCPICPYSIMTIEHLPAIAARKHQLIEELEGVEQKMNENPDATVEELDADEASRAQKSEDIGALEFAEATLNSAWREKKKSGNYVFVVNAPEILKSSIEQGAFPSPSDDIGYFLSRLEESVQYPFSSSAEFDKATLDFRMRLLANTGHLREALKPVESISRAKAEAFSMIQSLKRDKGFSNIEIAQLNSMDIEDLYEPRAPLVSISTKVDHKRGTIDG